MVAVKYNPENCLARFFGQINNVDSAVFFCPIFTGLDLFCQKLPGKWCVCIHCIGGGTWYTPMSSTQYVGDILGLFCFKKLFLDMLICVMSVVFVYMHT